MKLLRATGPRSDLTAGLALRAKAIKVPGMADKPNSMPTALRFSLGKQGQESSADLERRDTIVIGRGLDCDVVINDVKASRRHCRLTRGDKAFVLEDLGSKNGTYVDGVRITGAVTLKPSQTFKIGDTVFYLAL